MTYVDVFNGFEAVLWASLAVWNLCRSTSGSRSEKWLASGTLLLFAVSELVELKTGAWWKPWWLAAWKAACIGILVTLLVRAVRSSPTAEQMANSDSSHQKTLAPDSKKSSDGA